MKSKFYWYGLSSGFVGGILLGFFFKAVETTTGSKVYTLLLNIDFFPGVKERLPEQIEFAIHLFVSLLIGLSYFVWMEYGPKFLKFVPTLWFKPIPATALFGIMPIGLFVPLTLISDRTPEITDMTALYWWTIGHIGYGVILMCYGLWAYVESDDITS